ncbi:MAG: hypothetical protein J5871_01840 [Bacteroidales bacterium]|nr:hypothetical protein [Bacteroidales bacterium]
MRRKSILFAVILLLAACAKEQLPQGRAVLADGKPVPDVPYLTAILPDATKTVFRYADQTLTALWAYYDAVSIVPNGYDYYHAGVYRLPDTAADRTYACFERETAVGATGDYYTAIYPGRLKSYAQFTQFRYEGQVQRKAAPMAHLMDYFSMLVDNLASYGQVDFSASTRSSCMRFDLSGMTFHTPTRIILSCPGCGEALFTLNNVTENTLHYTSETYYSADKATSLSLDLTGYGDAEQQIIAYMMMSNAAVSLPAGTIVRVKVECEDGVWYNDQVLPADMTLTPGYCHRLTVDGDWTRSTADYTRYAYDGEVAQLQAGKAGLDLIIMGDGFIAEDFDNGTYDAVMQMAVDQFFYHQPLRDFRSDFNIYSVKVVSPERPHAENTGLNGARNTGAETALGVFFTPNSTFLTGNHDAVLRYAAPVIGDSGMSNATILVVVNQACYAGTCHNFYDTRDASDYGRGFCIAYSALGMSEEQGQCTIRHEAAGHGFGKLADEYYYTVGTYSQAVWNSLAAFHAAGMYRNVDRYVDAFIYEQWQASISGLALTDRTNVLWRDMFNTVNDYETVESLGVYQGGYTRDLDCCRPVADGSRSVMSGNRGVFNAVCRRQIFYRLKRLSGEYSSDMYGTEAELAAFLAWDAEHFLPGYDTWMASASIAPACVLENRGHTPPVCHAGHWETGRGFVEE